MKAAVVSSFDAPPRYEDVSAPSPGAEGEIVLDVVAVGLHPRVRSQADGSHYTSNAELPIIPGIDGVGRGSDGALRYFVLPDTTKGAMAQQVLIDARRSVLLPGDSDQIAVAAAMNPGMSSWVGLRQRIEFEPGGKVLVLGATGNAGRMAVQIARLFGADQVVAVGRDAAALSELSELGATDTVELDGRPDVADRLGEAGKDADVVIDYLWGEPTADALSAIIPRRTDDSQQLTWLQIGSVAGATSPIPSAALRAARLQIVGSGQGSVSTRDILTELPALAAEVNKGTFRIDARPVPLRNVEQAWTDTTTARIVFTPQT